MPAAEAKITDGTIYDGIKLLRNKAGAHGTDEALARARCIGIKGRQATPIALEAGADLHTSFVNEQITPE